MQNVFLDWLKALFRWFSFCILIPLLALAILLTPLGLKIGVTVLSQIVPGELHYKKITGTLLGPLTIKELSYRYQDRAFSINRLYLQWHPSSLLAGRIFIETINMDNLLISTPQAPTPSFSPDTLKQTLQNIHPAGIGQNFPLKLKINHSNIRNLTWQQQPGKPTLRVADLRIQGIMEPDAVKIKMQAQLIDPYFIQADLSITGTPAEYRFNLNVASPQNRGSLNGNINADHIQMETEKALIFGGELSAHLTYQWKTPQTPISWQLSLKGRHLDFSPFQPHIPHPLDILLDTTGTWPEAEPYFSWKAKLQTAQMQITTQGNHEKQWNFNWDVDIHELAEWLPFGHGMLSSTGELHGDLNKPQTKGHLKASLLRWQNFQVDKVTADWNMDISKVHPSFFQVAAEQLLTPWAELKKIQLSGQGQWENHTLNATLQGYNTDLQWLLSGGFSHNHWQGSLRKFTLVAPHAGAWSLAQPTALYFSTERAEISALCLQSNTKSQLCLLGKWNGRDNAWQTALTGRLNFQQLASLAPEGFSINLPMDLHLNAKGIGGDITQAELTGHTQAGDIRYSGPEPINVHVNSTQLSAKIDKNGAAMGLHLDLADHNSFSTELNLPGATRLNLFQKNQALHGKISIALNKLSLIQALIPDTVNPQGKLQAHLTVGGTLGEPLITGQANMEGGELKIPDLNIQLNQINLALNAKGSALNYTLTATSANKPLRLVGTTYLNQADFPTEMTLTGDAVLIANTDLYTLYASPNIHVILKGRNIDISGAVDIPKALLHQLEFQTETTLPEGEVIFIGKQPLIKTTPWKTTMQLTINLGNDIKVESPGLKGKLSGSVTILSQSGEVMLGIGRIDISDGLYKVFGRELSITPGSGIIYRRNPLNNPTLSIQAITRVVVTDAVSQQQLGTNEITVGMNIAGTSTSPQVTLFSSAGNLSQADMISFLLLGTSSAGISPTNMNLLLQALNSLPLTKQGTGNVEGLTNQVKQGLGLTELGVESEPVFGPMGEAIPTTAPSSYFVVGKRLTSHIYLRYKYDPFSSINLFQMNYLFSKAWSLQLETDGSTQSGADILYTIQTGTPTSADKTAPGH